MAEVQETDSFEDLMAWAIDTELADAPNAINSAYVGAVASGEIQKPFGDALTFGDLDLPPDELPTPRAAEQPTVQKCWDGKHRIWKIDSTKMDDVK